MLLPKVKNKRKSSENVELVPIKATNPYLERAKRKSVDHPLSKVPEFCRLDMSTLNGRNILPKVENSGKNELLNSEVLSAYFQRVFHNRSGGYFQYKLKELKKRQK